MRQRKSGRIVFVSSAAPLRGIANYAPYVAARAAANGLVASLAKELGRDGITVNAVGSNYVENPDYFPPQLLANPEAMAKMTAAIRLELGLDRPIPVQFLEYILRVLRGDLGRSIISNKMVIEELGLTIGPTLELMLGAMLIAVPCGLALGTLAAVNRGRLADRIIMACSVAGVSMPVFFIGLL